jgi:hypothetical protein
MVRLLSPSRLIPGSQVPSANKDFVHPAAARELVVILTGAGLVKTRSRYIICVVPSTCSASAPVAVETDVLDDVFLHPPDSPTVSLVGFLIAQLPERSGEYEAGGRAIVLQRYQGRRDFRAVMVNPPSWPAIQ